MNQRILMFYAEHRAACCLADKLSLANPYRRTADYTPVHDVKRFFYNSDVTKLARHV
jgi:hypothetical protein